MRYLKFYFVLPTVLLPLTLIFIWMGQVPTYFPKGIDAPYCPTMIMVAQGLTAPAEIFRFLTTLLPYDRFDYWVPYQIWDLELGDFAFLVGVPIVWFLVGLWLDTVPSNTTPRRSLGRISRTLANSLFLVWGCYVAAIGLNRFGSPTNHLSRYSSVGDLLDSGLFLGWSLFLILMPGRELIRSFLKPNRFAERVPRPTR